MENKDFDTLIRQSLETFEVPLTPNDWAMMAEHLDADLPDALDVAAKEALSGFEAKSAADWSLMGALLDAEMLETDEDEGEFLDNIDHLARAALGSFSMPFVAADWERLDESLDKEGFPHEVDEVAKAALQAFEAKTPSDWAAMEAALSNAEKVRRGLFRTKAIEVLLFLLGIWTLGYVLPFEQIAKQQEREATEMQLEHYKAAVKKAQQERLSPLQPEPTTTDEILPPTKAGLDFKIIIPSKIVLPLPFVNKNKNTPPTDGNQTNENATMPPPIAAATLPPTTKTAAPIVLAANFLATKDLGLSPNIALPKTKLNDKYLRHEIRARLSVAPQHALMMSEERINSRKVATGVAASAGFDYALSDKVELSTGIVYSRKSYLQQQQQDFANPFTAATLNSVLNVELDMVQIPVRATYSFRENDKTRLYGVAGITAGMIMKVVNTTREVFLANASYQSPSADQGLAASNSRESEGALQSGEVSANTFVTADFGFGLEYKLNNRVSFFIEPMVQHSLHKIGNDDERYKNYAFAVGSRVLL